ncbi:MAG: hypothetical protein KGD61_00750, partial [Candidatus Lokiarchaeota archaeon]|nr:hypothetical protein [Candidatus Lokiarchaeota archaeon]
MNDERISTKSYRIIALVALVFGLFATIVTPLLIEVTYQVLITTIVPLIPGDPELTLAPGFITTWFFAIRGIDVVAGITLVVISRNIWKGESWTYPITLSCISLPTILGILTTLPYLVHVGGPPPAIFVIVLGLISYFTVLLLKRGDKLEKIARLAVFTLLGVTAGQINVLVMHGIKGIFDNPDAPLLTDPANAIYGFEVPLNLIAMLMCIFAIPLLATDNTKRRNLGWLFGVIGGITVAVANFPTHFIRLVTNDFLLAGILG